MKLYEPFDFCLEAYEKYVILEAIMKTWLLPKFFLVEYKIFGSS